MKLFAVFFVSILGCVLSQTTIKTIADCPAHLRRDKFLRVHGDSCYLFSLSGDGQEYPDAENFCEQNQGTLLKIKDAETQAYIYHMLKTEYLYNGVVWLGLSDAAKEGVWVWEDGTPLNYSNWASGQPGLLGGLEDCAAMDMRENGQWHDYRCSGFLFIHLNHFFICEYNLGVEVTTTTTASTVTEKCPPLSCGDTDCGLNGHKTDDKGCAVCDCEE